MSQEFKRFPAVEKSIADIEERDVRVRVTGTVIDNQGNTCVLDDGTGRISVTFDTPLELKAKLVRVIGRVMPFENGVELRGEIIQNMEGLDLYVFKKLSSIK
ncbi:MAG TPA: replication protein RepA [archaeon]|nr:replication protein RepA [archaeon]